MCLRITEKSLKYRPRGKRWVTRYKLVRATSYRSTGYGSTKPRLVSLQVLAAVRPGIMRSNRHGRLLSRDELKMMEVGFGIHVYKHKVRAWPEELLIAVRCDPRDFVARGVFRHQTSEVWTKVWVPKSEVKRALALALARSE